MTFPPSAIPAPIYRSAEKAAGGPADGEDKQLLLQAFVRNKDELEHQIAESSKVGTRF